jgi:hypothetical protein
METEVLEFIGKLGDYAGDKDALVLILMFIAFFISIVIIGLVFICVVVYKYFFSKVNADEDDTAEAQFIAFTMELKDIATATRYTHAKRRELCEHLRLQYCSRFPSNPHIRTFNLDKYIQQYF